MLCLAGPRRLPAQSSNAVDSANQQKARALLEETIQALGGQAWLDLKTIRIQANAAAFFQGNPTGAMAKVAITRELPDKQRIDLDKGKVDQLYDCRQAWEITYQGKKPLPAEQTNDSQRWCDHSLGAVLRQWLRDPNTVLIDRGQSQLRRQSIDSITLIDSANNAVTLEIDTETNLPARLSFRWRDPRFHDENLDAVEYDNYQRIDGIATPFTITWTHNRQTVRQLFLHRIEYNIALPKDFFNPDTIAAYLK